MAVVIEVPSALNSEGYSDGEQIRYRRSEKTNRRSLRNPTLNRNPLLVPYFLGSPFLVREGGQGVRLPRTIEELVKCQNKFISKTSKWEPKSVRWKKIQPPSNW